MTGNTRAKKHINWRRDIHGKWFLLIDPEPDGGRRKLDAMDILEIWCKLRYATRTGEEPPEEALLTAQAVEAACSVGLHSLVSDTAPETRWRGDGWKRCLNCGAVIPDAPTPAESQQ